MSQASDQSLFWDLLSHQPPLQQQLAKVSLGSLVMRIEGARLGRFTSRIRCGFDRWLLATTRVGKADVVTRAEELSSANSALEQRYVLD